MVLIGPEIGLLVILVKESQGCKTDTPQKFKNERVN